MLKNEFPIRPGTPALWWLALWILVLGGSLSYWLSLPSDDHSRQLAFSVTLCVTLLAAGLCIICATASWWFKK